MENDGSVTDTEVILQVERALYQLYNDPDPTNKTTADRWLQALQQSPQAWNLPWILLQHQSFEVKNFGSLMLCNKINQGWSELPPDHYNVLRLELFKHLAHFSTGQRLILIQLCRSLVGVAFQTMPDQWPNMVVSSVHSLRKACQDLAVSDFASAVIQFLTILSEEFDKMSSNILTMKRGIIKNELKAGLQSVLSLMEEIINKSEDSAMKNNAIKCCGSWLHLGCPLPEMRSIIQLLLRCLGDPELLESASDTLCEMVTHDDSYKYPTALRLFLQSVLERNDFFRRKLEENDPDVCMSLVKLVQGTAMANVNFIVGITEDSDPQDGEDALAIVELLLEFLCIPGTFPVDEQCSDLTFQFWESFLDHIASADSEQSQFLLQFFSSHTSSLIEVFPHKAQYPSDEDWKDSWIDDERDDFIKYREDLCDLGECLQLNMHIEYLQHLSSLFSSLLSSSQPPTWQSVEAVLCLLQGVAANMTPQSSSSPLIQSILTLFPNLPAHPVLLKTALSLLGLLSSWFRLHPSLLQGVLPMILGSLSQAELAPSAALAFRDLCSDCALELANVASLLIPHCQQGLSNPNLASRDCVRLVAAIGSVLSVLPLSSLLPPMESLVASRVERIQALAREDPSETNKVQVEKELDILSSLCHHICPNLNQGERHPVVLLLIQLFPAVQTLINKWCRDHSIMEGICIMINRAMRTVGDQYAPLLEETIEIIVKCYTSVHHHKLLDSAAQVIDVFGQETSCGSHLTALIQPLHSSTLQLFQSAMGDHPDIVQSYLRLNTTTIKVCPGLLLSIEGISSNLFDVGLAALKLPEQPTVSDASSFLVTFIEASPSVPVMADTLSLSGKGLVHYIVQAVGGAAPRSYVGAFSDILNALLVHCLSSLSNWLEELLSLDGFPSSHLTAEEKRSFRSNILRGQNNKRILKERLKEFALKCRGFHGTLYGSNTF